jgi:hypothetical protein
MRWMLGWLPSRGVPHLLDLRTLPCQPDPEAQRRPVGADGLGSSERALSLRKIMVDLAVWQVCASCCGANLLITPTVLPGFAQQSVPQYNWTIWK